MLATIVIVLLIIMLLGALPVYPYSRTWGPYPSGGLLVIIVLILVIALLPA